MQSYIYCRVRLRSRQALLPYFLAIAGVCGTLLGCGELPNSATVAANQASNTKPKLLAVNVVQASLDADVYEVASSFGVVKPRRTSSFGFARGGRVAEVAVEVGSVVKKEDRIAELEQDELKDQQIKLKQQIDDANQQLTTLNAATVRSQENQRQVALQQTLATLNAQEQEVARELSKGVVSAPYDGVIAESSTNAGDTVPSGRPLFKILDSEPPIVELNVPIQLADKLQVGQVVWIKKDGTDIQADVATKAPELNQSTRTQTVTLIIPDKTPAIDWTFGDVVEVQFWTQNSKSGYWLPYSALRREADGLWSAFVLEIEGEQQIVSRRILEILQLDDQHALVSGKISAGDYFISDGINRIVAGQQVIGNVVISEYQPPGPPGAGE